MRLRAAVEARPAIKRRLFPGALVLLIVTALCACSPAGAGGGGGETCPAGLEHYKGKCLTHSAVVYVGCTEDRGQSWADQISAGATLPTIAKITVGAAYKRSQQEDSVVALQIVKDCLKLAEAATTSGAERASARQYQQQVIKSIAESGKKLPAIGLQPLATLKCGSADVVAAPTTCPPITITNTGWAPLHVTHIEKTGRARDDFEIGGECADTWLTPSQECALSVGFAPSAVGERIATLIIHQNLPLPDSGTRLRLTGTGTGTGTGTSQLTHTLTAAVDASAVARRIVSSPPGIRCPGVCTAPFDDGTDITLSALPDRGVGRVRWAGCDTIPDDDCIVRLTADRAVTADFLP